ncbi:MAG TPA: hypothetical protein EYP39_01010, partial [Ghiorsea sp.]|nr:hypothetical protein [Ghiorsea sp.]
MDLSLIDRMANYSPDFEWPAATLTDELVTEIQDYLQSVAKYLEKDFPAPALRTTTDATNRSEGPLAYIVYFYNGGKNFSYARYNNNCENLDGFIELNSATITKNGKAYGIIVDGKITNKGYGDLAHELFHAIQRTTRVGRNNCHPEYGDWITEAQAEAFGHDMARKFRGKAVASKLVRWGGRNSYSYDLYIKSASENNIQRDRAYQTSSFWRYLAEAWHLRNTSQVSGGEKPGPDMSNSYDTDYRYIASLMDQSLKEVGRKPELRWLDKWLRQNLWGGLNRVYTDFISVLPEYAVYRFNSSLSAEDARKRWLDKILSADTKQHHPACKTVFLKPGKLTANAILRLAPVASNCMIVDISSFTTPKTFEIS